MNLANEDCTTIKGEGTARINVDVEGKKRSITLENTQLVPDLRTNLLSVSRITKHGFRVIFDESKATVLNQGGKIKLIAKEKNGLYVVEEPDGMIAVNETANFSKSSSSLDVWHRRFGHLNTRDLQNAIRQDRIRGVKLERFEGSVCSVCLEGKMVRNPFPMKSDISTGILDLVHTDLCGPMKVPSLSGSKYILQFIDDNSRYGWVYFLKSKLEVSEVLKNFAVMIENQVGKRIKCIQSDNGTEFVNATIDDFLKERGIIRRLSVPYNPQQNGVVERRNRTLVEMARCLLLQSGLPTTFWAEAVNTANHVRNRCPTSFLNGMTPLEAFSGYVPYVSYFRKFGSNVLMRSNEQNLGKFETRSIPGIFIGYSDTSKGYRVWIPDKGKVFTSRDVRFLQRTPAPVKVFEDFYPEDLDNIDTECATQSPVPKHVSVELGSFDNSASLPEEDIDEGGTETPVEELDPEVEDAEEYPRLDDDNRKKAPGRPRIMRTGKRGRPRKQFHYHREEPADSNVEIATLSEVPMKKALSSPEADAWRAAMIEELTSIIRNDTWTLVDRPNEGIVIGCRMNLRNKVNTDGSVQRRKARLVAQ